MNLLGAFQFIAISGCFFVFGFGEAGRLSIISSCVLLPFVFCFRGQKLFKRFRKSIKSTYFYFVSIALLLLCILIFISASRSKLVLSLLYPGELRVLGVLTLSILLTYFEKIEIMISAVYSFSFGVIANSIACIQRTLSIDPSMMLNRKVYGILGDERHVTSVTNACAVSAIIIVSFSLFLYIRFRKLQPAFILLIIVSTASLIYISIFTLTRMGFFVAAASISLCLLILPKCYIDGLRSLINKRSLVLNKSSFLALLFLAFVILVASNFYDYLPLDDASRIFSYQFEVGLFERFSKTAVASNLEREQLLYTGFNNIFVMGQFSLFEGSASTNNIPSPYFHNFLFDMVKIGGLVGLIGSTYILVYLLSPLLRLRVIFSKKLKFFGDHRLFWLLPVPGLVSAFIFLNSVPIEEGGSGWNQLLLAIISTFLCQCILDNAYSKMTFSSN